MSEGSWVGRHRVAIVGCGVSGLAAIKACLEEGLQPCCFDVHSHLGGLWYTPDSAKYGDGPRMYDTLVTNASKAMMCFSDFPCPANYPPFMPHRLYQQYLESYAEHFKLLQHVVFNTKVVNVDKADDYDVTGRWVVTTCQVEGKVESGEQRSEVYDGVILCQGFFCSPHIPDIPGLRRERDQERITVSHVNSYKNALPFRDNTVVVVGSSHSAIDVACDIAPVAKQVYLSVNRGTFVLPRLYRGLTPYDFRLTRLALEWVPRWLFGYFLLSAATQWLNPLTSGLKPSPGTQPTLTITDHLPVMVMTGQVKVVCAMDRVTDTGDIHLQDGQVLTQVDHVVFGTGYKYSFSNIDPAILTSDPDSGRLDLYKMAFPLSLTHDSLALVGCFRTSGPFAPSVEVQARLVARVLARRHQLPDRGVRQLDVDRINQQQLRSHGSYKYIFLCLLISDNIAEELGIKPIWWRLLLRGDVKMASAVMLGPAYPFHYRLQGPHAWAGAREATLQAYDQTVYSVQHRKVGAWQGSEGRKKKMKKTAWGRVCMMFLVVVVAGIVYYVV